MQPPIRPSHSLLPPAGVLVAALAAFPVAADAPAAVAPAVDAPAIASPAAAAPAVGMPERALVAAIAGWVAADMGVPVPAELPRIRYVDRAAMQRVRAIKSGAGRAGPPASDIVAFYEPRTRTIHLGADWSGSTPADLSVLVHEMVHHVQTLSGETFACPAAREKPAFAAQQRWLETFGEDLEGAVGIDRFTLLVATNCMY